MNNENRLKVLETQQEYQVWIAAGEFFRRRSVAELLFFSIFGWFLSDYPNVSLENRRREFEFPHYRIVVDLHENVPHPTDQSALAGCTT